MLFTTDWIKTLFPEGSHPTLDKQSIATVEIDSRLPMENGLFVPLIGERVDGHAYIEQAYAQGAVAALWSNGQPIPAQLEGNMHFFLVDDPLEAMQTLAQSYRAEVDPIVVGITGSNGKTTTKDIVQAVVETTYRSHCTKGNLNNHIGLPLTILSMPRNTEVLIVEMGMNAFGEIQLLSTIAKPDYGIIVHIGESHIEHLGSREGIAQAKLEIIDGFHDQSVLIYDGDEPLLQKKYSYETIRIGYKNVNDKVVSNVHIAKDGTTFTIEDHSYTVPLLGKHHAKNAAYAVALAQKLNIDQVAIVKGLADISLTSMRFEQSETTSGMTIINDAYNASPTSMKAAIDVVKQMEGYTNRVLVLGDILELGERSEMYHRSIAEEIEEPVTAVYTFGSKASYIYEALMKKNHAIDVQHVQTKENLCDVLANHHGKDTIILLKASRGIELETIIPFIMNQ